MESNLKASERSCHLGRMTFQQRQGEKSYRMCQDIRILERVMLKAGKIGTKSG